MKNEPTPLDIPYILRQAEIKPSKGLGQNFLSDPHILARIVESAGLSTTDAVLEIGPGLGSLTLYLAASAGTIITVELDRKLFALLTYHLQAYSNVTLVQGDILELDPKKLMKKPGYVVVANIPYYITSALIRHLLESDCRPTRLILTVQREVAERICAKPGHLSLLALSVQVYGQPSVLFKIPASAFYPPPKVDSAVLSISLHPQPLIDEGKMDLFFKVIKAGFSQKRKTLRNSLSGGLGIPPIEVETRLKAVGIDPQRRAETLSIPEWNQVIEVLE